VLVAIFLSVLALPFEFVMSSSWWCVCRLILSTLYTIIHYLSIDKHPICKDFKVERRNSCRLAVVGNMEVSVLTNYCLCDRMVLRGDND